MAFCSNCGAQNAPAARFCAQCGHAMTGFLPPGQPTPVAPPPTSAPQPAIPHAAPAQLHGRYQVVRLLGQGGMGAVYLAQDKNAFNRRCVVKEMLPYYSNPAEKIKAEKDFEREARVLATLRCDGAPQIYEYFIEQAKYYLVMEYVEGENLEDRLTRLGGKLPLDEVLEYGAQLANTLVYLARQSPPVIHRDIKPANIILDQDQNKVKLVDFGLAKENVGSGMTGTLSAPLGTPGYAPMEQYTNQVEPRTDIYALGATLHHFLSGRDPRTENSFDFPPLSQYLPGVRPEFETLIARMVAMKVSDRPAASEVRDELEAMLRPQLAALSSGVKPFTFRAGPAALDADELALLCDQHWEDGVYHLYAGHFEAWLDSVNRHDLAVRAESIRIRGGDHAAGLEEFLRAANPTIPLPSLAVSTRMLDFGCVEKGATVQATVQIKNAGRGCLYGRVAPQVGWVVVRPQDFSIMPNQVIDLAVTFASAILGEGAFSESCLEITSNGGMETVAAAGEVTWQPALSVEPRRRLAIGDVTPDHLQPVAAPLVIRNTGGGVLQGFVSADQPWLTFDAESFAVPSGGSVAIQVTANVTDPTFQISSAVIRIQTGGQAQEIIATVGVRRDWYDPKTRTRNWLAYGTLTGYAYVVAAAAAGLGVLFPVTLIARQDMDGWYWAALICVVLAVSAGAALYFGRRWAPRLDELENYYHGRDLAAELQSSRFRPRKLIALGVAGLVVGTWLGMRSTLFLYGNDLHWLIWTPLLAVLGGLLFGAVGAPSPVLSTSPALARLWRGATLDDSQSFLVVRTTGLMLIGAWFGVVISAGDSRVAAIWWGALVGMLLATETHRFLALRVRWLLVPVRMALVVGLGVYFAIGFLSQLRDLPAMTTVITGYGRLTLGFPGIDGLLWLALLTLAGWLGALGGLWVMDNGGLPRTQAWRLLLGMTVALMVSAAPLYLLLGLLFGIFIPGAIGDWVVFLVTAGIIGFVGWALLVQRAQVESVTQRAQGLLSQGVNQSKALTRNAQGRLQQQGALGSPMQTPGWFKTIGVRARGWLARIKVPAWLTRPFSALSLPSLAELENSLSLTLAAAAAVVALILIELVVRLMLGAMVGLGIIFVVLFLAAALLVGLRTAVIYLRSRNP
ncbi:MAG: protein kinase [Caldilinea sp.]|nr:protein kinase [Caldilinea sp.]MCB9120380.1 protein kinase [Caldilineaceae bacterium]